jgi:hypothetical protein
LHFVAIGKADAGMRYVGPQGAVTTTMVDPANGATMYGDSIATLAIPTVLMVKDETKARRQLSDLASSPCEVALETGNVAITLLGAPTRSADWTVPVQLAYQGNSYVAESKVINSGEKRRIVSFPIYGWHLARADGTVLARVQSPLDGYVRPDLDRVELTIFMLLLLTGLRFLLMPPRTNNFQLPPTKSTYMPSTQQARPPAQGSHNPGRRFGQLASALSMNRQPWPVASCTWGPTSTTA